MLIVHRLVRTAAALAIFVAFLAPGAAAQQDYVMCGELIDGVTCPLLFLDDDGDLWLLDEYGSFGVGDRVLVIGSSDPTCPNICNQGNGCIFGNSIEPCGDPTDAYCFCDPLSACGNTDPNAGCRNSTGGGALLAGSGTVGVGSDDLVLTATGLPPFQNGILYMGPATAVVPFGDGLRCVGPGAVGFFRFPIQNAGNQGVLTEGPIVGFSHANFPPSGQIQAGDTWYFQAWYRDPVGPCGGTFNLSNGVSATFTP